MPNKRNKNRDKIAVTLSADKRDEINEYLATQHSIKDTVELALLLAKKTFGLRDLEAAYQDYALSLTPGPFLNGQNLSSTVSASTVPVTAASPERDAQSDKKVAQNSVAQEKLANKEKSKESLTKKRAVKSQKKKTLQHKRSEKTSKASKKLDPKAINQLFDSGNLSDL